MQTQTHLLISAALRYPLEHGRLPVHKMALWLGAVLPDLPFTLLSISYAFYYYVVGKPAGAETIVDHLDYLFFNDPLWLAAHNTPHSLVINGLLIGVGYRLWRRRCEWGLFLFWLASAMLWHTLLDIPTHRRDGPLFLYPLNATYRFQSPLSYWESGYWFTVLEYVLGLSLLLFLLFKWRAERRKSV